MSTDHEIPTTGSVRLPPDPRSFEALGRNHTLEAALAELVDNSIDADAGQVLIRFVRDGSRLLRLLVADDGQGMDQTGIDVAMTVGGARAYRNSDIGRFGLGLKSASFSQARSVTVISRAVGQTALGRRWQVEHARHDFRCEVVRSDFAANELDQDWQLATLRTGTVVRWDSVKAFPARKDSQTVDRFLHEVFGRIRTHLGLIFHRLLHREQVRIFLEVSDLTAGVLQRVAVTALDPFGYPRTGAADWPKVLSASEGSEVVSLGCHIWPGRSNLEQFRLDGDLIARQGIYVYYQDRLVQRGGWNGLLHADKQLSLARLALEIDGDVEGLLALKPEKNGIEVGPDFQPLVHAAQSPDGTTFADYVDRARGVLKDANRRRRVRQAILPPGSGLAPAVRRALENELPLKEEEPVDVRWAPLDDEDFFWIDREQGVLWLNSRYRQEVLGGRRGSLNDVPLIKALMFLLTENIFAGQNLGPRDKDNLEVWQHILTAAARSERG